MENRKLKVKSISVKRTVVYTLFCLAIAVCVNACQSASEIELAKYISNGKDIYQAKCQNCHGANGEGLGELSPPLTDTTFLKINKQKIACYIKHGANEEMIVNGISYHDKMPGFTELHTIDIAQLTVYITNAFGNNQGMYTQDQVAEDLANCK